MATATMSGTQGLLERVGRPDAIPDEVIRKVIQLVREGDVEVLQFRQQGYKAVDGIYGRFQLRPEQTGDMVQRLLDLKREFGEMNFELKLTPMGITEAPAVDMEVRAGSVVR